MHSCSNPFRTWDKTAPSRYIFLLDHAICTLSLSSHSILVCNPFFQHVYLLSLAYTELEQAVIDALKQAKINIDARTVNELETTDTVESQRPSPEAAAQQEKGERLLETTKILIGKYGPDVVNQLANMDVDALIAAADSGYSK